MSSGRRSFSAALATSIGVKDADPLKGPPPADANKTFEKLAMCLGLRTARKASAFLQSNEFKPIYMDLYKAVIEPKQVRGNTSQGPQYAEVAAAIHKGEAFGKRKYDARSRSFSKEGWTDVDHYAYCLVSLRNENKLSYDGIFRSKVMKDSEIDARLWQCMLKATSQRSPSVTKKKRLRAERLQAKKDKSAEVHDTVFASQSKKRTNPFLEDQSDGEDSITPPASGKRKSATSRKVGLEKAIPAASLLPLPIQSNPAVPNAPAQQSDQGEESLFVDDNESQDAERLQNEQNEQPEQPAQPSPANANQAPGGPQNERNEQAGPADVDSEDTAEDNIPLREQFTGMEYLRATRNAEDPMDITTHYGAYMTIQNVLRNFNDTIALERLAQGPTITPQMTAEEGMVATHMWERELESILKKQPELDLGPPSEEELKRYTDYEKLLDNAKYQPQDFDGSCTALSIDPEFPNLPSMNPTIRLEGWQVTGIKKMWDMYREGICRGVILADVMGLGKTYQMFGFWLLTYLQSQRDHLRYQREVETRDSAVISHHLWEAKDNEDVNPIEIPDPPEEPAKSKPVLIVVLPELISQTYKSLGNFSSGLQGLVYYDDNRASKSAREERVEGLLKKTSKYFNGNSENGKIGIITTLPTLRERHGPQALYEWRVKVKNMSEKHAKELWSVIDPEWPGCLQGCFDIVFIDEAHTVKNVDTSGHLTIAWLLALYHLLATASVLGNRLSDYGGFNRLIQPLPELLATEANLRKWGIDKSTNPYELPDDHPAAILRLSSEYVEKYITSEKNAKLTQRNALYLRKVWEKVLIRRTYASKNPANPARTIGEDMAGLYTRRIVCSFTESEQELYNNLAAIPMRKLIIKLPGSEKLAWNRKHSRMLILLSTWIGWEYIHEEFSAKSIAEWKSLDHLLWRLIAMLHRGMVAKGRTPTWSIPAKDNIQGQLAILCMGSPKIRATLRIIAELVILQNYKMTMWSSLPANQILLHAIIEALCIQHTTFTSDLDRAERDEEVRQFTENSECMIWNGGYYVGSFGLDLQTQCHHSLEWDGPPTKAHKDQAIGRCRRFGQSYDVEHFELYVDGSFQSRIIVGTLEKAVPCALAELSINISKKADNLHNRDVQLEIGTWYLSNGHLISSDDPRVESLPPEDLIPLTPENFITALQDMGRGKTTHLETHPSEIWEKEDVDFDLLPSSEVA